MTDEEKNLYDSQTELAKIFWNQYNERRKYEFQISIAIWTAFVSFIYLLYEKIEPLKKIPHIQVYVFIVGGLIFLLHLYWINGIFRANLQDSHKAHFFTKRMQMSSNSLFTDEDIKHLNYPSNKHNREIVAINTKNQIKRFFKQMLCWTWSQFSQCFITLLLYIVLIFIAKYFT